MQQTGTHNLFVLFEKEQNKTSLRETAVAWLCKELSLKTTTFIEAHNNGNVLTSDWCLQA